VSFFKDGKRKTYLMPNELAEMVQYIDAHTAGIAGQVLSSVGNAFRTFTTAASAKFAGPNILRDNQGAVAISFAYQHIPYGFRTMAAANMWRKAWVDAFVEGPWWREFHESRAAFANVQAQISGMRQDLGCLAK